MSKSNPVGEKVPLAPRGGARFRTSLRNAAPTERSKPVCQVLRDGLCKAPLKP